MFPPRKKSMFLLFLQFIWISLVFSKYHHYEDDVTITEEQRRSLQQFKTRMFPRLPHDYIKTDIYLLKWLRSRHFNKEDAETDLVMNLKWREENQIDSIQNEDFSDFEQDFRIWMNESRDRRGKPICYYEPGTHDTRRVVLAGKSERYLRYAYSKFELACSVVRELGMKYGNVTRGHVIVNMQGYNLVNQGCLQCIPVLMQMLTAFDRHWPECLDQYILLNTPGIIEPLLKISKSLVSELSRESLQVFGTNRKEYRRILSKEFDFSQLPIAIGGEILYPGMDEDY